MSIVGIEVVFLLSLNALVGAKNLGQTRLPAWTQLRLRVAQWPQIGRTNQFPNGGSNLRSHAVTPRARNCVNPPTPINLWGNPSRLQMNYQTARAISLVSQPFQDSSLLVRTEVRKCRFDKKCLCSGGAANVEVGFEQPDKLVAGCPEDEPYGVDDRGFTGIIFTNEYVQTWQKLPVQNGSLGSITEGAEIGRAYALKVHWLWSP
ncbi:Uncharacterised protein [Burkholderia pseudomallei]|nr:Uncharacterised protein [Burkholderia pseudomallei]